MNIEDLRAKVREWDLRMDSDSNVADSKYSYILSQLEHNASRDWRVYLPAEHPDFNPNYLDRLARWVGNLHSEDDQKLLLEYASYISFFCHEDFAALYRTAFNREIMRWVASQVAAKLEPKGGKHFESFVRWHVHHQTWFCPVTDSMDINEFCKVNHLQGIAHHPAFAALQKLAEEAGSPNPDIMNGLKQYMACPNSKPNDPAPPLERLVLLEDIVGSSTQCIKALRWAVGQLGKPVLFVPLILCPNGVTALHAEEQSSNGRLAVRPIIELRRSDLLGPERRGSSGWSITEEMEDLARRCSRGLLVGLDPFGYLSTGCSLATFTNTPDNTIPIVHHKLPNGRWEPLFPRVFRD